jgi:recombination protein RecA
MDIRRIGSIKDGDVVIGSRVKVKVVKNKVAAPFKEAEFDILYNEGISREGELLDMAIEKNFVQKSGTWFSYGEERIGQGRENARVWLKEHADATAEIDLKLRQAMGIGGAKAEAEAPAALAAAAGDGRGERRVRI